ncbi:hypothetical protein FUAX_15750 [Fulvitalea axinellae]|uniref:Uncharacterized protein n=1 Tax=Fulvitalea axinellae TaxID=1182444 RepID=A0AAU9CZK4_9BACT|nr:hypothetical protein FUAX_15750 [Fulvitalea axinellae]
MSEMNPFVRFVVIEEVGGGLNEGDDLIINLRLVESVWPGSDRGVFVRMESGKVYHVSASFDDMIRRFHQVFGANWQGT